MSFFQSRKSPNMDKCLWAEWSFGWEQATEEVGQENVLAS